MLEKFEKFVLKKIFRKLAGDVISNLPALLEFNAKFVDDEKKKVNFAPDEIQTLFPTIDYDRKKFFVFVFRLNKETQQIEISRTVKEFDLTPYFNSIKNANTEEIEKFIIDKIENFDSETINLSKLLNEKSEK